MSERISLADLVSTSVPISPAQVVALIGRLSEHRPVLPTILDETNEPLTLEHVWVNSNGDVQLSPNVLPRVQDLGALLEHLLAEIRRRGPIRIAPGLVMVAARATGRIDLAPIPSPAALASALERFAPPDPAALLCELFEAAAGVLVRSNATPAPLEAAAPVVATTRPSSSRRGVALFAVGAVALAAGVAVAMFLPFAGTGVSRTTETTEVVIGQSEASRRTAPSISTSSKPSGTEHNVPTAALGGRRDRRARGVGTVGRTPAPVDREGVTSGSNSVPEKLVEPEMADADGAFSPSFAANGTAVFFHAKKGDGSALKRADRDDGGELHVVSIVDDKAENYHVQVSPDGRSVAFDSDRDGIRGVYVAAADGSNVRRVSGAGYAAVPTWSPDGRRLAFLRAENDRPKVWNLWTLELARGTMTRRTNHRYGQVWGGAWFPDGRRLAYSHEDQLLLLDLESNHAISYASPRKGQLVRTPAVSPDGRWIVFQVFRDGAWLLDLKNSAMERVLDDPSAEEFTWAPDGRRVAFHSRRSGEWGLWVMAGR